ncbi:hypothetical protein SRHO_G00272100 [Serrasalmus rhombeus]
MLAALGPRELPQNSSPDDRRRDLANVLISHPYWDKPRLLRDDWLSVKTHKLPVILASNHSAGRRPGGVSRRSLSE